MTGADLTKGSVIIYQHHSAAMLLQCCCCCLEKMVPDWNHFANGVPHWHSDPVLIRVKC